MKKKFYSYLYRTLGFALGFILFYIAVENFGGFQAILPRLKDLGWGYLFVMLSSVIWMFFYTEAWHQFFVGLKHQIRFLPLLKVKLCGEAVNFMTPAGFLLGDSVRVLLLKKYVGPDAHLRSVVIDRTMHSLAAQVFCFFGLCFIFVEDVAFPVWIHLILLSLYFFLSFFLGSFIIQMLTGNGLGFFEKVFRFVKLEKRLPKVNARIEELKDDLHYYKDKPKAPFLYSFFLHFGGRALGAVEIGTAYYFFTGKVEIIFPIILASITSFVQFAGGFIPGALGFLEALYGSFFTLYGFQPEVGVSIQLIRRLRVFFWIFVGLLILDFAEVFGHLKKQSTEPEEV